MKRYDLPSTYENIKATFIDDRIKRNEDLVSLVNFINSVEGCYSIALDSHWGSGKTFFVKQIKMIFDSTNEFVSEIESDPAVINKWTELVKQFKYSYPNIDPIKPHVTVYYDAWENDSDDDPLLSLVYQIMCDFDGLKKLSVESNITQNVLTILKQILKVKKGIDIEEIAESLRSEDFLAQLKSKKDLYKLIADYLDNLLPERGDRLIIIIDELDRCNPVYAVKILEQIKHYFDNERITFVFSVNLSELEHTICKHYGSSFNAGKYLDRFFDWRITLPKAEIPEEKSLRTGYTLDQTMSYMIKRYNMQMREIGKYIPMTKTACTDMAYYGLSSENSAFFFVIQVFIPLALALKITDPKKYNDFISGRDHRELIDFATNEDVIDFLYDTINLVLCDDIIKKENGELSYSVAIIEKQVRGFYSEFFSNNYSRNKFGINYKTRDFFFNQIQQLKNDSQN